MNEILEKLTKQDLINVIAHMHDIIKEWEYDYGFSEEHAKIIAKIGDVCVDNCGWDFPEV